MPASVICGRAHPCEQTPVCCVIAGHMYPVYNPPEVYFHPEHCPHVIRVRCSCPAEAVTLLHYFSAVVTYACVCRITSGGLIRLFYCVARSQLGCQLVLVSEVHHAQQAPSIKHTHLSSADISILQHAWQIRLKYHPQYMHHFTWALHQRLAKSDMAHMMCDVSRQPSQCTTEEGLKPDGAAQGAPAAVVDRVSAERHGDWHM